MFLSNDAMVNIHPVLWSAVLMVSVLVFSECKRKRIECRWVWSRDKEES